jgi:hypothetical protein
MSETQEQQVDPNVEYLAETLQEAISAASPAAQEAMAGLRSEVRTTGIVCTSISLAITLISGYFIYRSLKLLDKEIDAADGLVAVLILNSIVCVCGLFGIMVNITDITQPTIVLIEKLVP